ncbi:A24 family peptidase, partial [Candidatus Micrarchaeota archaeon]|nr:A24 family peptidase [Candidatus Micrarchaeota archaeon]MBU1930163.1 A24 family peptidase [Candidatus Micrarchaeota archaeon]
DWLTMPLIGIGIILNLLSFNWMGLGLGIAVFGLLYALYWLGKLGGGDVKLFTGIAMILPFYQGQIFLIPVLFFAGISAITFYSIYYLIRIWKEKIKVNWKENRDGIIKGTLFGALFTIYFVLLAQVNGLSVLVTTMLWIPFVLASIFVALEKTIKKHFFIATMKVKELEEDEVIALEFTDEKILKSTGLGTKGIIGEKEKQKLKEMGVKEVLIYAHAPKFGPFIFLGVVLSLWFPEIIRVFFLGI